MQCRVQSTVYNMRLERIGTRPWRCCDTQYQSTLYSIQYTIIQLFNGPAHRAWVFLSILIILGVMYEILINKVPMIVSHITNTYIRSSTQEIGAEH